MRRTQGAPLLLFLAACAHDLEAERRLDPATIPKFVTPLPLPRPAKPLAQSSARTEYRIAARQIVQQVLPEGFPTTPVYAFGEPDGPDSFHWPGPTIEARSHEPVRVTWVNELVDAQHRYLRPLLPFDGTLHWANPAGPPDSHGAHADYDGPVPLVVHVHGAHVHSESDGQPEAWYLPDAVDIPAGYVRQGTRYASSTPAGRGEAVFDYPDDRPAATLFYHDHALGITRLNMYAGLAAFWFLRDEVEDGLGLPGPAPAADDPDDAPLQYREIPLLLQDRSFYADGRLYYPSSRATFEDDHYAGPYRPETNVPPVWHPEFFGDTITVNGATWPYLEVAPGLYRFRLANGSNSRFFDLALDPPRPFVVIGADNGFLDAAPAKLDHLLLQPAGRADVLVDLSDLTPGDVVTVRNLGPDDPFNGEPDAKVADPDTTGQVMELRVVSAGNDPPRPGGIPDALPVIPPEMPTTPEREVMLWEETDPASGAVAEVRLGTPRDGPLSWDDAPTEKIHLGDTEVWRIVNTTDDAHPIHLHLVHFRVLDRTPYDAAAFKKAEEAWLAGKGPFTDPSAFVTGEARPPGVDETGRKDTATAYPGELLRIVSTFDIAGEYVWHCHMLEHEDNEMMRRLIVE